MLLTPPHNARPPFRQYFYGKEIICITESKWSALKNKDLYDVWQVWLGWCEVAEGERDRELLLVDHFA